MSIFKVIGIFLLWLLLTPHTYAQRYSSLQLGAAIPLMEFADLDSPYETFGGTSTALSIGLHNNYQFSKIGFGMFLDIDMNLNSLKKEYKENIKGYYNSISSDISIARFPQYFNFPITFGLNYNLSTDNYSLYLKAGLAANTLKMSHMEIQVNDKTFFQKMAVANSFGIKAGCELLLYKKFTFSVDYFALGNHTIESHLERKGYRNTQPIEEFKVKVNIVTITAGYKLPFAKK